MDCATLREQLLDAFDARDVPSMAPAMTAHLASCPECASFAARQRGIDACLTQSLRAPALSPAFRSGLRSRIRRERARLWMDALPDIVHFASCGAATLVCAALAPVEAATVLGVGVGIALGSYVVLAIVRQSFTEMEQPDR